MHAAVKGDHGARREAAMSPLLSAGNILVASLLSSPRLRGAPPATRAAATRLCESDDADAQLRAEIERLQRENAELSGELRTPPPPAPPPPPAEPDLDAEWRQIAASEAPVSAGFNFESDDERRFVAGIDTDPESGEQKMLSFWSSGLSVQIAFAAIALTFVFYVYVGVTGGITDGFDRFDGPGESVQQTLADPNYQPPLPPGAWTTGIQ